MSDGNQKNANALAARGDDLAALAERAREAHRRVAESLAQALANALEVGGALLRAKEICPEGKFTAWLRQNCDYSLTTARGYMRLVTNWSQLKDDQRRAVGLSQRQLRDLLKGLPCSDGRENPHARRLASPAAATAATAAATAATDDDELATVERLLEQVTTELRRLSGRGERSSYAAHLLQPLDRIRRGIPSRKWFWDLVPSRR